MAERRRGGRLGPRLALAFVTVAFSAVGGLGALVALATRSQVAALVQSQHRDAAADVAVALADSYTTAGGWDGADLHPAVTIAASRGAELDVLDADGRPVSGRMTGMAELMARMHGGVVSEGGPEITEPVSVGRGRVGTAVLRFSADTLPSPEIQLRQALTRTVAAGAGLAALIALGAAVFVSRHITDPIVRLTAAAKRLAAGDRSARAELGDAPGEVGVLAEAFDAMADALDAQDRLRRNMVSDVAHELRTPVTVLRAYLEEMTSGNMRPTTETLVSLHDEVLRLGRLVEDLETLSAAEASSLRIDSSPVDLAEISRHVADVLRHQFESADVELSVDLGHAVVRGDAERLRQVVSNLLTNALKFTPAAGRVTLRTGPGPGEHAWIQVRDTGPGISADELPHVFERFWRGKAAHGKAGRGIGLAVASEIAKAHGGVVDVESQPGSGAVFTVRIPTRGVAFGSPS